MFAAATFVVSFASANAEAPAASEDRLVFMLLPRESSPLLNDAVRRTSAELVAAGYRVRPAECAPPFGETCPVPPSDVSPRMVAVALEQSEIGVLIQVRALGASEKRMFELRGEVQPRSGSLDHAVIGIRAAEMVRAGFLALAGVDPKTVGAVSKAVVPLSAQSPA